MLGCYRRFSRTFAALVAIVGPPSCTIVTFHTPQEVDAFAVAVASAVVFQALVDIKVPRHPFSNHPHNCFHLYSAHPFSFFSTHLISNNLHTRFGKSLTHPVSQNGCDKDLKTSVWMIFENGCVEHF